MYSFCGAVDHASQHGPEFHRIPKAGLELLLRLLPIRARSREYALALGSHPQRSRPAIAFVRSELDESLALQRPQVMPQCRAVHHHGSGHVLHARRPEPIERSKQRILRDAQPTRRQRGVIKLRDLASRLP